MTLEEIEEAAIRGASSRVRVRADGGRLYASVDGEELYRTDQNGEGVWAYRASSTWDTGARAYVMEWKQITGTSQCRGRAAFRRFVARRVAREAVEG